MEDEAHLESTVDNSDNDIEKSHGQEVIGLFLTPQQVFSSSTGESNDLLDHSDHSNAVTVLTATTAQNEQASAEHSSSSSRTDSILDDDVVSESHEQTNQVTEDYPGSDHHGNLTANDLVSSAVVVSSDPRTVYLDQGGVALAELLPGTVSIPVSGTGEATFVHHSNDGNVVIATEPGSFDGISMATISHAPPAMTTDQQLAALSQFASNISHHVTDHDQPTLYVLEDPSAGHHDDDHQH
ncbi:Hypothetical predicted protein, partial [Paramuricea clavata]